MEIVRGGFRPVLPGMGTRVGAHAPHCPVAGGTVAVVLGEHRPVVGGFVAKQFAKPRQPGRIIDQEQPVVMRRLMPKMPHERPQRLVELHAPLFSHLIVRLRDVQGDDALLMPCHDRRPAGSITQELKAQGRSTLGRDPVGTQAEFQHGIEQTPLGRFDSAPALQIAGNVQIGNYLVQTTGRTEGIGVVGGDHPVADPVLPAVGAKPIGAIPRRGGEGTPPSGPLWFKRGKVEHVRQKTQCMSAMQAKDVFEKHHAAADIASEGLHDSAA